MFERARIRFFSVEGLAAFHSIPFHSIIYFTTQSFVQWKSEAEA